METNHEPTIRALQGVNLAIRPGWLIGPNGPYRHARIVTTAHQDHARRLHAALFKSDALPAGPAVGLYQ